MEVLLDTSFILSCIRKRIDFLSQLKDLGFKVVVPREVLEELKDLRKSGRESREDRTAIAVALKMFELNKVKKTGLGSGGVDSGLIEKGKKGIYIATLDAAIKRSVPNKIVIFDSKKSVGILRS